MNDSPLEESKERPYICPCGKSYLSYPALFTHVKQKHQGVPPGQIIRPKVANKRGRPRKNANESNQDALSPAQDNKGAFDRLYLHKEEDESYLNLMREAQKAKKHFKPPLDFVAPISFAHLVHKHHPNPRPDLPHPLLQASLRQASRPYSGSFLEVEGLEGLIEGNRSYQKARGQERCRSRRPIGMEQWEMELRTGVLEFLEWAQGVLGRWEYRNLELLMGLLLFFYGEMLPEGGVFTTTNYLTHLNLFARQLLNESLTTNGPYEGVFSLTRPVALSLLAILQEWFLSEGLSHYELKTNPSFSLPSAEPHQN